MFRKTIKWMIPYYIYQIIVFILIYAGLHLTPNTDAAITYNLLCGVYLLLGMHAMGLVMGMVVQHFSRSANRKYQIVMAFIAFLFNTITIIVPESLLYERMPQINLGLFQMLGLALFSALMFLVGEISLCYFQKQK